MFDSWATVSPHPTAEGFSVRFEPRVLDGISSEVLSEFNAVPRRGAETGGILLGRRPAPTVVVVEDFEPVLCEHRFGPSYRLSEDDFRGLAESLEWFRDPSHSGLDVIGFYRSETRGDPAAAERDNELIHRFFPDARALFLLLKPERQQTIRCELLLPRHGVLQPVSEPMPFPFEGPIAVIPEAVENSYAEPAQASFAEPEPMAPEEPPPAEQRRLLVPPPVHPRRFEPEETRERAQSKPWWLLGVGALTIAGLLLGYRSAGLKPTPPFSRRPAKTHAAAVPASAPAESISPFPPALPADSMEPEVRAALDQWLRAERSGNPDLIAACYAPRLERYFDEPDASPDTVRRAVADSNSRFGKLGVVRLSEVKIIPLSADRALATFRKHWQTFGPRMMAGEVEERLTFAKLANFWKVAAEQETRVYWTQRSR